MKELDGSASVTVPAAIERCYELLAAVERYPTWAPDVVTRAEVVERRMTAGRRRPGRRCTPRSGRSCSDFDLLLAVEHDPPRSLRLVRIPHDRSDPRGVPGRLAPAASRPDRDRAGRPARTSRSRGSCRSAGLATGSPRASSPPPGALWVDSAPRIAGDGYALAPSASGSTPDSRSSNNRLRSRPPPNPTSFPSAPITRWHGTITATGLRPLASPTARAASGEPICRASSP